MAVVEGIEHRPGRGAAGKTVPLATLLHRQERLAVIGLEHQQVIGASFQDLVGDRLLAAHGVQGHDAVLQRQRLEQRWDRGDLVRLAIDLTLAEGQALLAGPGADQMQWPLRPAAVEGAAQGLAVNGHDLPVEGLGKGLSPGAEAGLEGIRVDQHEDAPEGVVRGNAVSQAQERPQPAQLVTAIERDVVPALGTGDHSAHRDHQDIDQPMINLAGTPRILKRRKVLDQLLNRHRRPPFVDEGRTVTPRYTVKSHQPISCVAPGVAPSSLARIRGRWADHLQSYTLGGDVVRRGRAMPSEQHEPYDPAILIWVPVGETPTAHAFAVSGASTFRFLPDAVISAQKAAAHRPDELPAVSLDTVLSRETGGRQREGDGKTMIDAAGLVGSEGERSSSMPSITGQAAG